MVRGIRMGGRWVKKKNGKEGREPDFCLFYPHELKG